MGELVDLVDKIKKYYQFSPAEIRSVAITIFFLAFIVSFGDWGPGNEFQLIFGLTNLVKAILIVTLSFLVHLSAKKIMALHIGFRAEYNLWTFGLLFSLMIVFVSTALGKPIWLFLVGGIMLQHMAGHRLGFFRYDINYYEAGWISMMGPLANIGLAFFLKMLTGISNTPMLTKAIEFNLLFALYNSLPIPPLDGSRMFFGSRMLYALSFFFVIGAVILLWVDIPLWISFAGSVLISLIGWLLYYIFIEQRFWRGPYP